MSRIVLGATLLILGAVPARSQEISPDVDREIRAHGSARVVVAFRDGFPASNRIGRRALAATRDALLAALGTGFRGASRWTTLPGLAGELTEDGRRVLAGRSDVGRVDLDVAGSGTDATSNALVGADQVQALGFTGAGVVVAVLDSGIDAAHPDLAGALVGEQCFCTTTGGTGCCPNHLTEQSGPGSAADDNGHGTNVAGIIASRGSIAPRGIAPGASLVAVKVLDANEGFSGTAQVLSGLDWILSSRPDVRVVNMSLGTFALYTGTCDGANSFSRLFGAAIDALRARGTIVFVSSGNDRSLTQMELPACIANAVAVGAVYSSNVGAVTALGCTDATTATDKVTCFSNAGSALDLLAPGAPIRSTGFTGGTSIYVGTSQASPHAAGGASLLFQKNPTLTPAEVERALETTGKPVTDQRTGAVTPRIQLLAAIQSVDLPSVEKLLPVVLDAGGAGGAHYTTELTLSSRSTVPVPVDLWYESSVGSGSGALSLTLASGELRIIPDAIAFLRAGGVPIPADGNSQIGTLRVIFQGVSSTSEVFVGGRTSTPRAGDANGSGGTFGLFYVAAETTSTTATIFGLQQNASQRSNLALVNAGPEAVTLRLALGGPNGELLASPPDVTLPAYGWTQINQPLLGLATSGRAVVARVGGTSSFSAYGVLNDAVTSDGSFLPPLISADSSGVARLIPIVLASAGYQTEITLTNLTSQLLPLTLTYTGSPQLSAAGSGSFALTLQAGEQRIEPDAIAFLRSHDLPIPSASSGGSLLVSTPAGTDASALAAGARTFTSGAGGTFGLFYPGLTLSESADGAATVNGLQQGSSQRSNLAVVNRGDAGDLITFTITYAGPDGVDLPGVDAGTLAPGEWRQFNQPLASRGVAAGSARIERLTGSSRFVAYGVLNDQRTGDGSYIPMVISAR